LCPHASAKRVLDHERRAAGDRDDVEPALGDAGASAAT
jgi:hypothetical protein